MNATFTTNDGVRLSYTDHGTGAPVVFVHAWQGSSQLWSPVAEQLAGYRRVLYDQRGHGASADPEAGWHLHRLAFDLHELLDHLALDDVTLIGHSMGCSVIWAYLELFGPARVHKLAFADQTPLMIHEAGADEESSRRISALSEEQVSGIVSGIANPATREHVLPEFLSGLFLPDFPEERKRDVITGALRVDGAFSSALFDDLAHQDWRRQVRRIEQPTLVIAGGASVVPLAGQQWVADHVPGARLEVVDGADGGSHMLVVEADKRVAALLATFLED
ncbi:alpha/beta fold hydrolase [Pseudonocardia alaniniphila]|uniref:Alpha/beta hydrolase n=1 Tax=Pseudonocardia alaniniphila TaxID=75291 RepID=A0ABS9TKY9_9PSEU|nr:alpha/beta hydrolase [Pseudonocardia alaniniphila]MCH6169207.1 alpha/beta hydrolase [Pseudonocardia alaniniphila]